MPDNDDKQLRHDMTAPRAPHRPRNVEERDACAIIAFVDKNGRASHAKIHKTIEALKSMAHRSGDIFEEGDGCGILTDIPRAVWANRLEAKGLSRHLADSRRFFVGHLMLPAIMGDGRDDAMARIRSVLAAQGLDLILEASGETRDAELGPRARAEAPLFWQVAGMVGGPRAEAGRILFRTQVALEAEFKDLHIASLSTDSVVFKVRGTPDLLPRVYPCLNLPEARSVLCLGHGRYSTNTLPTVERAQPFSILGHNGEINTIERLRSAARALGIEPVPGGSDSQDVNRILEGLIHLHGFDPLEALAMVFPAVHSEVAHYAPELRAAYDFYRWFFPPSAQGPAAVLARHGHVVMGSVDALGLRPLWFGETDYDYLLSSEKGVADFKDHYRDPKPLAPGEKLAILAQPGRRAEVFEFGSFQKRLARLMAERKHSLGQLKSLFMGLPSGSLRGRQPCCDHQGLPPEELVTERVLGAFGWQRYDVDMRRKVSRTGKAVIGSMGHQAPLACLAREALPVLAEFFKENVAVVTNPAIDREREADHFTTRVILGDRPRSFDDGGPTATGLVLDNPILPGACPGSALDRKAWRAVAKSFGTATLEDAVAFFTAKGHDPDRVAVLDATFVPDQGLKARVDALCDEAEAAVKRGAVLLVADDSRAFTHGLAPIDPGLAVAALTQRLEERGLSRRCSLVVRSGSVRNLHDIMFLLGLGAQAVNPYLLWRLAEIHAPTNADGANSSAEQAVRDTMSVLQQGVEKVMSTMGIHELCGYGRIFASIGLLDDLTSMFRCADFCTSDRVGVGLAALEDMARRRIVRVEQGGDVKLWSDPVRNPKVGKAIRAAATGDIGHRELAGRLAELETGQPIALRHLLDVVDAPKAKRLSRDDVDITVGVHDMPLVIPAMSFGSQGENSFRTYAEAAKRLNIVCVNGEGGEIPDMLGRYHANRAQQVASGRFGVFMRFLNSAAFLEIKIGQGAKPGEGGHLPGTKVTRAVAGARHCVPGVTLISPSNHHDIYSIEDLAQIVSELKTANPGARVSVKIPVTAGVGTIAVGVAKAGADIVNISGFDGGTGAAREHSKKYVGLPAEVGVSEAHRALEESDLRHSVEIWCDGGMRSGMDVVKMVLLGADRVAMGTVCLMSLGCISCRRCHLDACPMGISTQLADPGQAKARGVRNFRPRDVAVETDNLVRLLGYMGEQVRTIVADMGFARLRDLVGRTDLLRQTRLTEDVDCSGLLADPCRNGACEISFGSTVARKPLNYLTKLISDMCMERFRAGATVVHYKDDGLRSQDRSLGTHLAGAMVREFTSGDHLAFLRLGSSVPGNGLCAFNIEGIEARVDGGAQDGTAKGSFGGVVAVMKGANVRGQRVDGAVGKSFAYGAIGGRLLVQGFADSRACVRMSGADVVFGGRITERVRDEEGNIASRSHLKGFAFEYMTGGRAVVLGDPGPWICAGMTGGVVYQCLWPEFGFDRDAVRRRLARYAEVDLRGLDARGLVDVEELLGLYARHLRMSFQAEEASVVESLLAEARQRFIMLKPRALPPHQE